MLFTPVMEVTVTTKALSPAYSPAHHCVQTTASSERSKVMFAKTFLRVALLCALLSSVLNAQTIFNTYTTLSGFYDYQTNNTCQYIRVNPSRPNNIHVIFMGAEDSVNATASRRTAYAFSSNGGATGTTSVMFVYRRAVQAFQV